MAWKNKPFRELHDIERTEWQDDISGNKTPPQGHCESTKGAISVYRGIHFEPIFNRSGSALKGVLYRPLLNAQKHEVLRHCMEGIDAIHYWQCSNRIIPLILPIHIHTLQSSSCVDGICDLILNSRLPVGLISLGLIHEHSISSEVMQSITRLRRLGVLFHWLNFDSSPEMIKLVDDFQFEAVHIHANLFRNKNTEEVEQAIDQIQLFKKWGCKTYLSHVTFVYDNEIAYQLEIDYCYGSLMLSPVTRHQIIHIQDSRIGKALFSIHTSKKTNPQGDL
jgi:EAL domain-containing protein (putative c-di-GMP-specific phosphodiesterase class I)